MGIAYFSSVSPSLFRTPGLSMLLAPVQALASLFMPVQPAQINYQTRAQLHRPEIPTGQPLVMRMGPQAKDDSKVPSVVRLKVMLEFEPGVKRSHAGRMVISGRMADVCAELDRIALKEARLQ
jgi:hypothetical protein